MQSHINEAKNEKDVYGISEELETLILRIAALNEAYRTTPIETPEYDAIVRQILDEMSAYDIHPDSTVRQKAADFAIAISMAELELEALIETRNAKMKHQALLPYQENELDLLRQRVTAVEAQMEVFNNTLKQLVGNPSIDASLEIMFAAINSIPGGSSVLTSHLDKLERIDKLERTKIEEVVEAKNDASSLSVAIHTAQPAKILPTKLIIAAPRDGKLTTVASFDVLTADNQEALYQLRKTAGKDTYTKHDVIRKYKDEPTFSIQQAWLKRNPQMVSKFAEILQMPIDNFISKAKLNITPAELTKPSSTNITTPLPSARSL